MLTFDPCGSTRRARQPTLLFRPLSTHLSGGTSPRAAPRRARFTARLVQGGAAARVCAVASARPMRSMDSSSEERLGGAARRRSRAGHRRSRVSATRRTGKARGWRWTSRAGSFSSTTTLCATAVDLPRAQPRCATGSSKGPTVSTAPATYTTRPHPTRSSERSVAEVADQLGFSDASNFSKAFKRWYGVSPDRFRQR